MTKCTFYIVRHGQSVANRDKIIAGQMDSPLTELGKKQALEAKEKLSDVKFDIVYSSDLVRAIETASIIMGNTVDRRHQLKSLRERSYGKIEGKPSELWSKIYNEFDTMYGSLDLEERWTKDYADYIENNKQLYDRFMDGLKSIALNQPNKTVLIGTHGGCIRMSLIGLGYIEESKLPTGGFANSGHIVLDFEDNKFSIKKVEGIQKSEFL